MRAPEEPYLKRFSRAMDHMALEGIIVKSIVLEHPFYYDDIQDFEYEHCYGEVSVRFEFNPKDPKFGKQE